jgi:hypothetical protein
MQSLFKQKWVVLLKWPLSKRIMKIYISAFILVGLCSSVLAQSDTIVNPGSVDGIPYYEQLYKYRVYRSIDLSERQNAGFKSIQSDIAKFILASIKNGKLNVYDDSLKRVQTVSETLISNTAVMAEPYDSKKGYVTSEAVSVGGVNYTSIRNDNQGHPTSDAGWWEKSADQTEYIGIDQILGLELREDVIFDKRRSRLFYDIQALGILAQKSGEDALNPRGYILYKDFFNLVQAYSHSKNLAERDMVMWRNRYNPAENRLFTDAFKLRLFHGVISKVENPDDLDIVSIITRNGRSYREAIYARWEEELKMMEKEHNLWEY